MTFSLGILVLTLLAAAIRMFFYLFYFHLLIYFSEREKHFVQFTFIVHQASCRLHWTPVAPKIPLKVGSSRGTKCNNNLLYVEWIWSNFFCVCIYFSYFYFPLERGLAWVFFMANIDVRLALAIAVVVEVV